MTTTRIIRFVLPFLFVRNWYDGSWELSRARLILFSAMVILVVCGLGIAYVLQIPVMYESTP
jgi:hypothetical protein